MTEKNILSSDREEPPVKTERSAVVVSKTQGKLVALCMMGISSLLGYLYYSGLQNFSAKGKYIAIKSTISTSGVDTGRGEEEKSKQGYDPFNSHGRPSCLIVPYRSISAEEIEQLEIKEKKRLDSVATNPSVQDHISVSYDYDPKNVDPR